MYIISFNCHRRHLKGRQKAARKSRHWRIICPGGTHRRRRRDILQWKKCTVTDRGSRKKVRGGGGGEGEPTLHFAIGNGDWLSGRCVHRPTRLQSPRVLQPKKHKNHKIISVAVQIVTYPGGRWQKSLCSEKLAGLPLYSCPPGL